MKPPSEAQNLKPKTVPRTVESVCAFVCFLCISNYSTVRPEQFSAMPWAILSRVLQIAEVFSNYIITCVKDGTNVDIVTELFRPKGTLGFACFTGP